MDYISSLLKGQTFHKVVNASQFRVEVEYSDSHFSNLSSITVRGKDFSGKLLDVRVEWLAVFKEERLSIDNHGDPTLLLSAELMSFALKAIVTPSSEVFRESSEVQFEKVRLDKRILDRLKSGEKEWQCNIAGQTFIVKVEEHRLTLNGDRDNFSVRYLEDFRLKNNYLCDLRLTLFVDFISEPFNRFCASLQLKKIELVFESREERESCLTAFIIHRARAYLDFHSKACYRPNQDKGLFSIQSQIEWLLEERMFSLREAHKRPVEITTLERRLRNTQNEVENLRALVNDVNIQIEAAKSEFSEDEEEQSSFEEKKEVEDLRVQNESLRKALEFVEVGVHNLPNEFNEKDVILDLGNDDFVLKIKALTAENERLSEQLQEIEDQNSRSNASGCDPLTETSSISNKAELEELIAKKDALISYLNETNEQLAAEGFRLKKELIKARNIKKNLG